MFKLRHGDSRHYGIISGSLLIGVSIGAIATPSAALANVGQEFGFGSRVQSLGGAGVAYGSGGYSAFHNPAALPFQGEKRFLLDVGVMSMNPDFTPIENVVVENTYVSDKQTFGNVEDDYRAAFGSELGLAYRLFPQTLNLTVGITTFLPIAQLAYMDTGEGFVPEYFMYRARLQRPQVEAGVGIELSTGLKLGVGLHMAYSLTSSGTVFLQTSADKPSTMRFAASLKPKVAPVLGVHYSRPGDTRSFTLGAVVRFPVASPNNLYLKSGARAFGSFAALDFNFKAQSTLYYDPFTVELGGSLPEGDDARTIVQLDYQAWSKFEAPALNILDPKNESCGNSPCGVNISKGNNPMFSYRDIVVPRIGQELKFGNKTLRAGYSYRPSILKNLSTGAGNFLDPPKHVITAGIGFDFSHFLNFEVPCTVDVNVAWHHLTTQYISKEPGDETGTPPVGNLKIGAPGYDAGGNIYGGGVNLSLAF